MRGTCRQVLLQGGDISLNPGPVRTKKTSIKCDQCEKTIRSNQKNVTCVVCFGRTHLKCTTLNLKIQSISDWTCSKCLLTELPFYTARSLELDTLDIELNLNHITSDEECPHRSALTENPNHLSLMHLNTQCMTSTFDELLLLLSDYPFNIVTLSETWLKDNDLLLQHVSIPGFTATYRNRQKHKGGGVGGYILDSLQFKRRTDIESLQPDFEHLWLEFPGRNKNSKLLIGTVYRSDLMMNTQDWLGRFDDLLSNIMSTWDGLLIVTGDININLLDQADNITCQYMDILQGLNLTNHVTKPTRTTPTSKSLIDHLISNSPSRISHTDVLPCPSISDHDAPYATINVCVTRFLPRYKYIRNKKNLNLKSFSEDFSTLPLNVIYGLESPDDMI